MAYLNALLFFILPLFHQMVGLHFQGLAFMEEWQGLLTFSLKAYNAHLS